MEPHMTDGCCVSRLLLGELNNRVQSVLAVFALNRGEDCNITVANLREN